MAPMSGITWAGALLALAHAAWAGDTPTLREKQHVDAERDLDAKLSSEYEALATQNARLTYLVCNRAAKALLFRWPKPGFESGLAHPLKKDTCAVYQREVSKPKLEKDAAILYTQSGQPFGAEAFVADETFRQKVGTTWTTLLRLIGLGEPYKQPDKRYDVKVVVTDKGSALRHDVTWSTEVAGVSIKLAATDDKARADVMQELARQPALASSSRVVSAAEMQKLLSPADGDRLSPVFRAGTFVRLEAKPNQPRTAVITVATSAKLVSTEWLLVLDNDNRVVWMLQYTTGSPD